MGIILSLILIAVGAILTWGVNTTGGSVNVDVVGVVLMVVGFVLFLISLMLWRTWWGAGFWEKTKEATQRALQSRSGRLGRNLEAPPFV